MTGQEKRPFNTGDSLIEVTAMADLTVQKIWFLPVESQVKFCVSLFTGYSLPCDAGFICLTGSNLPNPTDGIKGYICPSGHYCLSGAVTETLCDIGTYAPSTGLGKYIDLAYLTNRFFLS